MLHVLSIFNIHNIPWTSSYNMHVTSMKVTFYSSGHIAHHMVLDSFATACPRTTRPSIPISFLHRSFMELFGHIKHTPVSLYILSWLRIDLFLSTPGFLAVAPVGVKHSCKLPWNDVTMIGIIFVNTTMQVNWTRLATVWIPLTIHCFLRLLSTSVTSNFNINLSTNVWHIHIFY